MIAETDPISNKEEKLAYMVSQDDYRAYGTAFNRIVSYLISNVCCYYTYKVPSTKLKLAEINSSF